MKVTVVGKTSSVTKNGAEATTIHYTKEMTAYQRDSQKGDGVCAESVYTTLACAASVKVGNVCEFSYEPGFQGKAQLSDIKVIK